MNEQIPPYKEFASALSYICTLDRGSFVILASIARVHIKQFWKMSSPKKIVQMYYVQIQRSIVRWVVRTWIHFYGQTDFAEAALKMISKLKWRKVFRKYEHAPVKFALRVETLYGLCKKMDADLSTMSMPTPRQRKETLVDAFGFQRIIG